MVHRYCGKRGLDMEACCVAPPQRFLIASVLIMNVTLFLRYADWLTCHFERFSIIVLQIGWLVLSKAFFTRRISVASSVIQTTDNEVSHLLLGRRDSKGPVTLYNFSCNLQRNYTLKRCKFETNVWYVKNVLANCDGNMYLPILHLPCKSRIALQVARKIASCDRALKRFG